MPTAVPLPCRYAGSRDLYVKTYTTAYPFINAGWQWNRQSQFPMEFAGYCDALTHTPQAFAAQLIDFQTGYSKITCGDVINNTYQPTQFPELPYDIRDSQIKGWPINGTIYPVLVSQYLPYNGQSRILANNGFFGAGFNLEPPAANTQMPEPGCGINGLTFNRGIYCSSEITLTGSAYIWQSPEDLGLITNAPFSDSGLTFPTSGRYGACLGTISTPTLRYPDGRTTIIQVTSGTGGNMPWNCISTDFFSGSLYIQAQADTPLNSSIDFGAFIADSANCDWSLTNAGWLQFFTDPLVIDGVDYAPGWGIIMAADFSEYLLLRIVPQDTLAAGIFNTPGNGRALGAVDRSGAVWIKTQSISSNLFVGIKLPWGLNLLTPPNIHQIPPIFLPVNPGLYR